MVNLERSMRWARAGLSHFSVRGLDMLGYQSNAEIDTMQ